MDGWLDLAIGENRGRFQDWDYYIASQYRIVSLISILSICRHALFLFLKVDFMLVNSNKEFCYEIIKFRFIIIAYLTIITLISRIFFTNSAD